MSTMPEADGFLSRWSRRKALAREGQALPEPPAPAPVVVAPTATQAAPTAEPAPPPPPTLADTEQLSPQSDFTRFVAQGVSPEVKNAALKKLFADPHFNVMDGLDTYIDDYARPDPLPATALRQMAQAKFLGLLQDDEEHKPAPHEDPDLRLQPDHAPGPGGPAPGAGGRPGHGG